MLRKRGMEDRWRFLVAASWLLDQPAILHSVASIIDYCQEDVDSSAFSTTAVSSPPLQDTLHRRLLSVPCYPLICSCITLLTLLFMAKRMWTDKNGHWPSHLALSHLTPSHFPLYHSPRYSPRQADVDGNGILDYGEFLAATVHLYKIEREETLLDAFAHFDRDHSGYITMDELEHACKEYGVDESFIVETMRDVDTNNVSQVPGVPHTVVHTMCS